ncbi:MAG: type I 3-dehydroquinate dehydratase [Clostridia bacterium]|nr:type I 3-dehydroquinate dehydratase [Clostridia bacterium]
MIEFEQSKARMGGVILGEGMPKICVPVMGKTIGEIARAAKRARDAQADIVELRIDSLSAMPDMETAMAACRAAREAALGTALLFTMRTGRDGGAGSTDAVGYEALLSGMIESGLCDGVDCELSVGREGFARIAQRAKRAGVTLVGSSHEFGEIGDMQRAADWLLEQQELGADVCKAAVMTKTRVRALEAALMFAKAKEALRIPMIGIAMGPAGVITRIGCECMGSCLTFGTAGEASAPGQIDAGTLRRALEIIRGATAQNG